MSQRYVFNQFEFEGGNIVGHCWRKLEHALVALIILNIGNIFIDICICTLYMFRDPATRLCSCVGFRRLLSGLGANYPVWNPESEWLATSSLRKNIVASTAIYIVWSSMTFSSDNDTNFDQGKSIMVATLPLFSIVTSSVTFIFNIKRQRHGE